MDCATKWITASEEGQSPWDETLGGKEPNSVPGWASLISEKPTSHWNMASWGSNLGLPGHSIKEKHCSHGGLFQKDCKAIASVRQPWGWGWGQRKCPETSVMDLHTPDNVTGSDSAKIAGFE